MRPTVMVQHTHTLPEHRACRTKRCGAVQCSLKAMTLISQTIIDSQWVGRLEVIWLWVTDTQKHNLFLCLFTNGKTPLKFNRESLLSHLHRSSSFFTYFTHFVLQSISYFCLFQTSTRFEMGPPLRRVEGSTTGHSPSSGEWHCFHTLTHSLVTNVKTVNSGKYLHVYAVWLLDGVWIYWTPWYSAWLYFTIHYYIYIYIYIRTHTH
jgi:hypothetical protein